MALRRPVSPETTFQSVVQLIEDIEGGSPASGLGLAPTGSVFSFAGSTAPKGYLLCDGAAVSRTGYSVLFSVIGTAFGVGDGSTTFNLPDCRDRVPVGVSGTKARGSTGGAATHTLAIAELPVHSHPVGVFQNVQPSAIGGNTLAPAGEQVATATGNTGSGSAHNNMQPYQALNYIIKT